MHAVHRQDEQHQEIRNHHGQIERVGMINAAEGAVGKPMPELAKRAVMGREQE